MTGLIAVVAAVVIAILLVVLLLTYVWDSDDAAGFYLEEEYKVLGVDSVADYDYDETDAEKRVRLKAPAKEDVPANW